ncbi:MULTISPECIES: hypothetical protein [Kitasatospora]|uniref:hypothetical protein n=1 Tax=Kitasatospora TaxID=2063 RepID=UPI000C70AC03|nr:hypothetical protein [Kitasatospora sp. GP30]MDH6145745.1 hypothetical protein [Kitasatospora sp. GP30]
MSVDHTVVRIRPDEYQRVWRHDEEHRVRVIPVGPMLTLPDIAARFPILPLRLGATRKRPTGGHHDYVVFRRPGTSQVEIDATPAPAPAATASKPRNKAQPKPPPQVEDDWFDDALTTAYNSLLSMPDGD